MGLLPWDNKSVLLVADGAEIMPERLRRLVETAQIVVGIDGGTKQVLAIGLDVDVIIGDLDSLDRQSAADLTARGVSVLRYPAEKNATDTELAIELAVSSGAKEVTVVSGLGNRIDHSSANLLMLSKYAQQVRLDWETAFGRVTYLTSLTPSYFGELPKGRTFTIVALSNFVEGLSIVGAKYPLDGYSLEFGSTVGVSNEALGGPLRIEMRSGIGAIIFPEGG